MEAAEILALILGGGSLLTSAAGTGMNLLGQEGQTVGDPNNVTNLNAANTEALQNLLTEILAQSTGKTDQYAGQASQNFNALTNQSQQGFNTSAGLGAVGQGRIDDSYNSLTSLQGQLANMPGYNPANATGIMMENDPIYRQLAEASRAQALSQFETPATTQALLNADRNVQGASNQFANMGAATSGAAAAAAAQGAQAPLAQLALDRANLGNQAYSNVYNPLLQQGQQLATNQSQFQYDSGVQALLNAVGIAVQQGQTGLGQLQAAMQAEQNATNQAQIGAAGQANLSALNAGLQSNALSGLTSLGQPEYYSPTEIPGSGLLGLDTENPFVNWLQGLF